MVNEAEGTIEKKANDASKKIAHYISVIKESAEKC